MHRLPPALALIAFAACLVIGAFHAGNTFATTVGRALVAMAATYVLGLILAAAAQKLLDEDLRTEEEKLRNSRTENPPADR